MKKAFRNAVLFKVLSIALLILPTLSLFIAKKDVYFISAEETTKLSIGAIIALITIIVLMISKGKENKELSSFILIFKLAIFELILWLMQSILNDILIIIPCAIGGVLLSWIVETFLFNPNWETYQICKKASIDEKARQTIRKNMNEIQESGNV